MSFVVATPEVVEAAAGNLAGLGSLISAYNATLAAGVDPAAPDKVSASIAEMLSSQAQMSQAIAAQTNALHDQFVQTLTSDAGAYAAAETSSPITAIDAR